MSKAVLDDDSDGTIEADLIAAEVNDAIEKKDARRLGKYFERELDEFHTPQGSSYWSDQAETTADREQASREDANLRGALAYKVTRALHFDGIQVTHVKATEDAYVIHARDPQGRKFSAKVTYEQGIRSGNTEGPVGLVDRMVGWVVDGIRKERARYFERMRG